MANLVTIEHIYSINRMRLIHVVVTASVLISLMTAIGIIALLPAMLIARQETIAMKSEIATLTEAIESRKGQTGAESLNETRELMSLASALAARESHMTQAIQTARADMKGITIVRTGYEYHPQSSILSISGVADNREALVAYVEYLRKYPVFANVSAPVATLARSGGNFSVTIIGNF